MKKQSPRKPRRSLTRNDAKALRQFVRAADEREDTDGLNPAEQAGLSIGAHLVASVPKVMRRAYTDQLSPDAPAAIQWRTAWDQLVAALNARSAEPAVADALHALDIAHGTALVEAEDMTWHAAFRLATGLKGGGR